MPTLQAAVASPELTPISMENPAAKVEDVLKLMMRFKYPHHDISIPPNQPPKRGGNRPPDIASLQGDGMPPAVTHIMVVEDYAQARKLMSIYLTRQGYAVHGFGTAAEALAWAQHGSPAAIMLDLVLPDFSGLELYDVLRSLPHLKKVPTIFASSLKGKQYEQECLGRGAIAYFNKPASLQDIGACISQALKA